jgi:hypothetical protein
VPLPNYDRDREQLCERVADCVWGAYKEWSISGGVEPVVTASCVLSRLITTAGGLPGRFKSKTRAEQLQAVRSALRTEVNGGRLSTSCINGGTSRERTGYEPCRIDGQTWEQFFGHPIGDN